MDSSLNELDILLTFNILIAKSRHIIKGKSKVIK